ncbi:MAG: hypothetical protein A3G87_10385 [Omnitrophica bacterium RIFCSPLOWO2_12_FULL_50_11]|nr:MAG: hypothetical protein A3G87_10385 [Omnitrophica bacterium RIFCSPLOWO2_12_FULL_50_11]
MFHSYEVVKRGKPHKRFAKFGLYFIAPDSSKRNSFYKRMDIGLDDILTDQKLFSQKIFNRDI